MSDQMIEKVMTFVPQAQGMNFAELMALSKKEGSGFEGGGMTFLIFLLLLLGRNGSGLLGGGTDAAQLA